MISVSAMKSFLSVYEYDGDPNPFVFLLLFVDCGSLIASISECLTRMVNPNGDFSYKILIYDEFCKNILVPYVDDLLKHRVTLHLDIHKDRQLVTETASAVYFVQPTESNIRRIISDASKSLYSS